MKKIVSILSVALSFAFLITSTVSHAGDNSVPKSFNPVFTPKDSVKLKKFKDNMWITLEDLKFEFGEEPYRISLVVPAGFITDTTSMIGLRDNALMNNSSILHDYIFWVQPCEGYKGYKIANKIMKQTLKMYIDGKIKAWTAKKIVQAGGKHFAWKKNKKLKEAGNTRFAPKYIDEKYWAEIKKTTWANFRIDKKLKPTENDFNISDPLVCKVFPKWR